MNSEKSEIRVAIPEGDWRVEVSITDFDGAFFGVPVQVSKSSSISLVSFLSSRLIEQHYESKHILISVAKEGVFILFDITNRYIQQIGVVFGNDRAHAIEKWRKLIGRDEIFM